MEDVKWLLEENVVFRFAAVDFRNSRSGLLGENCIQKSKRWQKKIWEPPVEIENGGARNAKKPRMRKLQGKKSAYWFIPQASDDLLTEEEKEQLQSTVLSAAESVREIYKDIVIADALSYSSGISEFTKEQRKAVVEQLGGNGSGKC